MAFPDKELWDKIHLNPSKYEYVKIPLKVAKILKRKVGDEILLAYYYIEKGRRVKMLHYASYDGAMLHKGPGFCSEDSEGCVHSWETLAEDIADTFPKYKVKHRKDGE